MWHGGKNNERLKVSLLQHILYTWLAFPQQILYTYLVSLPTTDIIHLVSLPINTNALHYTKERKK